MPKTSALHERLKTHFGGACHALPVLEQLHPEYERANLHYAIEALCDSADERPALYGIVTADDYRTPSLPKFSRKNTAKPFGEGPVEYVDQPLPGGRRVSCVKRGLYLFRVDNDPLALLVTVEDHPAALKTEVMAATREIAEAFLHRLTKLVREGKAFRGHVLSLERDCFGSANVKFHSLPSIDREQVILPAVLLDRIERQTVEFSRQAARLAAAGRHLKRGVLLYGPPGTGKTFTAMYLASQMPERTVFLLTGAGIGAIEMACNMARVLQPATVILEDVDLIGTRRDMQMVDANALLFELLNQMDGLADDADILFLLTTNRPDVLEPALASRPGRIDQAIEVPPPDAECRARLFQLYADGLTLDVSSLDDFIRRTDGVSAAFIREALRKAAVFAALESEGDVIVRDKHLEEALAELLVAGGPLTRSLLGTQVEDA